MSMELSEQLKQIQKELNLLREELNKLDKKLKEADERISFSAEETAKQIEITNRLMRRSLLRKKLLIALEEVNAIYEELEETKV